MSDIKPLLLLLPDNERYQELHIVEALDPRTWTGVTRAGRRESLAEEGGDAFCEDMVKSHRTPAHLILISVEQDEKGCHHFVCIADAIQCLLRLEKNDMSQGDRVALIEEEEAKALRDKSDAVLLYARPPVDAADDYDEFARPRKADSLGSKEAAKPIACSLTDKQLCPHSTAWARNYTVIPDLSLGPTQRLILCDEATLTRNLPEERIFEYLRLIVNCHESRQSEGKYKVGACASKDPPQVILQAVHEWHNLDDQGMNDVNDWIQQNMWEQLQQGSVAVHCLAGIHRAACIVACHYLWRHYTLGHQDIPCEPAVIYRNLKAVRPAVAPAYNHVLAKYEAHLKRQAAARLTSETV